MKKATKENYLTVTIKRILWTFNLRWKFMCTDENKKKNKKSLLPFRSSCSFLNYWKNTKPMALKFLDFQFVSISCFY